jgi:hypothetical protein
MGAIELISSVGLPGFAGSISTDSLITMVTGETIKQFIFHIYGKEAGY